jgi:flagellar biosynthesis/type III secretory pathway M-ring protein FliF/YscJ
MLSQLIKQYFPKVVSAAVVIEPTAKRSLRGGGDIKPSASIFIQAETDADVKRLANGAASMVASAQSGLSVGQVSVSINGRTFRPTDPNSGDGFGDGEIQEKLQSQERYYVNKIRDEVLPHVPGALVTVSVDMEINSSQETKTTFDPAKTFTKESSIEIDTSESTSSMPLAPAEPGATANTGLAIEQAQPSLGGAGGNTTATEKNRTQLEVFPSQSVETIKKPPGKHMVQRAAVRVPQSYFVAQYRARNPSATTDPDDATLQPLVAAELDSIRAQVMACCGMNEAELVSVSPYFDIVPPMAAAAEERSTRPSGGGSASSVLAMVSDHVKEIAIGLLAVVSLFIVSSMVRKTSPVTTTMTTPMELREVAALAPHEDIAGEAREGSAMLDGMELDEDTIKAQQMVEQVSTMVEENPDAAASLVKRWLNRS